MLQYRNAEARSRRYSIGLHGSPWTCEEARGRAVHLLREIAHGDDPLDAKAEARAAVTVSELADLYLADGPADKPKKKAGELGNRSVEHRSPYPAVARPQDREVPTASRVGCPPNRHRNHHCHQERWRDLAGADQRDPLGQQAVDRVIMALGGVDLIVFDKALITGDMREELPWQQVLLWTKVS